MMLDINDETATASIDLPDPEENEVAISIYMVYDPVDGSGRYFLIEKGEEENVLSEILLADGKRIVHSDAPRSGSGLYRILEICQDNQATKE